MENRRKFYGLNRYGKPVRVISNWSGDTISKRLERIEGVLNAWKSGFVDDEDLKFILKNAFISRIYISVEAEVILSKEKLNSLQSLYDQLIRDGVLDLQDGRYGPNLSPYFDICKLGDKGLGISIEHVVPGDVYMKAALTSFSKSNFKSIFDNAYICLVTSKEAKVLDKKWKSVLPPDPKTGLQCDFTKHPFARYEDAGIEIHGWDIEKGRLKRKTK